MGRDLSLREAAVTMERRMASFYRALKERVSGEEARGLLDFLAKEEDEHAETLSAWAEEPTNTACLNEAMEDAGDIMGWFMEGVEGLEEGLDRRKTMEEILKLASQAEKDSILFYHTLAKHVKRDDLASQILDLIEFEYGHLRKIGILRNLVQHAG